MILPINAPFKCQWLRYAIGARYHNLRPQIISSFDLTCKLLTHCGRGHLNCLNAPSQVFKNNFNPLNAALNPICYLLALLAHHFLHVSRIRVKSLTLRLLISHTHTNIYIYIYIYIYICIYI